MLVTCELAMTEVQDMVIGCLSLGSSLEGIIERIEGVLLTLANLLIKPKVFEKRIGIPSLGYLSILTRDVWKIITKRKEKQTNKGYGETMIHVYTKERQTRTITREPVPDQTKRTRTSKTDKT